MRNLLKRLVMLILCFSMMTFMTLSFSTYNASSETLDYKGEQNVEDSICLSDYDYETTFTSQKEIEEIAQKYGIENPEQIEEIRYVPLEDDVASVESEINTAELGREEYYVKKKGSSEKQGELLRSSWYQAPGGSMTIKESVATTVSFANIASIEGGIGELKAVLGVEYGFSVTKIREISDTQNVTVSKGYKRNVKAYVNNKVYSYEIWEDDIANDDYIGKGTMKKPIGVIFSIGKQQKL